MKGDSQLLQTGGLIFETSPYGFHHPSTIHAQRDNTSKSQSKFVQAKTGAIPPVCKLLVHISSSSSSSVITVWVVSGVWGE